MGGIRSTCGHGDGNMNTLFCRASWKTRGVMMDKSRIMNVLRKVNDPEHPVSVVDMKIVTEDDVKVFPDHVEVEFSPTVPFCPMGGAIGIVIKYALEKDLGMPAVVKVKSGTHVQEKMLNDTLNDPAKYAEASKRFLEMGLMTHCIQS